MPRSAFVALAKQGEHAGLQQTEVIVSRATAAIGRSVGPWQEFRRVNKIAPLDRLF